MLSRSIAGAYRRTVVASTTAFGAHDQRGVVRQFPPQSLRPSHLRCPARVVQLRQAQIVQPCCSKSCPSELSRDNIAAISEDSLDPFGIEARINRAESAAPRPKQSPYPKAGVSTC